MYPLQGCRMDALQFSDGERTFTCTSASSPATPGTLWWWVSISGEAQRYAAFRAELGDTPRSLRPRVLGFYEKLLADRARPRMVPQRWGQRPGTPPAPPIAGNAG